MEDNELGESFFPFSFFFFIFYIILYHFPPPLLYRFPLPSLLQPSQLPMRPSELPLRPSELPLRLSPLPLRLSHLPLSPSQQPLRPSHTDKKKDRQKGKTSGRIDKWMACRDDGHFQKLSKKTVFIIHTAPFCFLDILLYKDVSLG